MSVSPFTFYRGTARIMAADLATTPNSGLTVQLGGDAHLSNFGAYASAERQLVFDANDFDETLPGPWEWDLKRLAASFMVAAGHLGFDRTACRKVTARAVKAYRTSMIRYAGMGYLDLWYDHVTSGDVRQSKGLDPVELAARVGRFERKARSRTSLQALQKLAVEENGRYRIRSDPPVLFPLRDLQPRTTPPRLKRRPTPAWKRTSTRFPTIDAAYSNGSLPWTSGSRSSAWGASGRDVSSCCSRAAITVTPSSFRSRRPERPCSSSTSARACTTTTAAGWSRARG